MEAKGAIFPVSGGNFKGELERPMFTRGRLSRGHNIKYLHFSDSHSNHPVQIDDKENEANTNGSFVEEYRYNPSHLSDLDRILDETLDPSVEK